jgi:hypothetical protein
LQLPRMSSSQDHHIQTASCLYDVLASVTLFSC